MTSVKRLLIRGLTAVWIKDEECIVMLHHRKLADINPANRCTVTTSERNSEFECFQQSDSPSTVKSRTHDEYESMSSKSKPYSITLRPICNFKPQAKSRQEGF